MTDDTWYFAYGSNLWKDQKIYRTGPIRQGIERPRIATLKDFRLVFNKSGQNGSIYANIMQCPGEEVIGVAYRWDHQSREKMKTRWEIGYEERFIDVQTEDNENFPAVTFIAKSEYVCEEGRPSDEYLCRILTGAQQNGLPNAYIQKIKRIAYEK